MDRFIEHLCYLITPGTREEAWNEKKIEAASELSIIAEENLKKHLSEEEWSLFNDFLDAESDYEVEWRNAAVFASFRYGLLLGLAIAEMPDPNAC